MEHLHRWIEGPTPGDILVAGDLILDRYVWGSVDRISPEAPIPVLLVREEEERIGGAGNVANNIATLGARVHILGMVGDDGPGQGLLASIAAKGIATQGVATSPRGQTSVKSRMIAQSQQMLRVDQEKPLPPTPQIEEVAVRYVEERAGRFSAVVISDYAKGFLTPRLLRTLIAERARGAKILVDPKGNDYAKYRGASAVTPNLHEAEAATGIRIDTPAALRRAAATLVEGLELEAAIITLGKDGIYLLERNGFEMRLAARARQVYDVTGAGDTVLAVIAFALSKGAEYADAVELANVAASIVVGKLGTAAVTRDELVAEISGGGAGGTRKILDRPTLVAAVANERARGRKVVFTNGCFDVLHLGHIAYLQFARRQGDLLVVGVNTDASVRRLKGSGRPIVDEAQRVQVLAALEPIDYVSVFDEETPLALVEALRPDVLVKGEDYRDKEVVGREVVEAAGGRVVLAPLVAGASTSGIVEKIRKGV